MRYLNFSEDFTEKIKSGEKRATLRLGIKDYSPGEIVLVRCGDTTIGTAIINKINIKKFRELDDADAILDGFKNLDELKRALEKFYGKFNDEQIFTQIIFKIQR